MRSARIGHLAVALATYAASELSAHTSIAVNGRVTVDVRADGLRVDYWLECGVRTAIDMRPKIDANADQIITAEELSVYNQTLRRKLEEAQKSTFVVLDAKPVVLSVEDVRAEAGGDHEPGVLYLRVRLRSSEPVSTGPHRLVLERDFCPFDVELLGIPLQTRRGHVGSLVRILHGTFGGASNLRVTDVSPPASNTVSPNKALFVLNNLQRILQFSFEMGEDLSAAERHGGLPAGAVPIDTVTSATPITLAAPARVTEISTIDALTFDPKREQPGRIAYTLSKPAAVRIRVHLRADEQLVLRTLLDWDRRPAGRNVELWDGRDSSGHLVHRADFPCRITIAADDAVHWRHSREKCEDLHVSMERKDSLVDGSSGTIEVRIAVDEQTRGYGETYGYNLRCYVDYELVDGFEVSGDAWRGMDYTWSTVGLKEGEHWLTVVVDDGADHVGSGTLLYTAAG